MSDARTSVMTERYGGPDRGRRRAVVLVSGLVGLVALAWLAWATWFATHPDVQSSLRTFAVVDSHTARATVEVRRRSADVRATCVVRAYGVDHSVVGEVSVVVHGPETSTRQMLTLRTERPATSVGLVGCTTPQQSQPR